MRLTSTQSKHTRAIRWLFFGPCGCGKTTLMAYTFIRQAKRDPGRPIHYFDHCISNGSSLEYSKRVMQGAIMKILESKKLSSFFLINLLHGTLTYTGKVKKSK